MKIILAISLIIVSFYSIQSGNEDLYKKYFKDKYKKENLKKDISFVKYQLIINGLKTQSFYIDEKKNKVDLFLINKQILFSSLNKVLKKKNSSHF